MILGFLFFAFIAYLVFKLVFDFIIPVYRTTKQVKQKFSEMRSRQGKQAPPNGTEKDAPKNKKSTLGDYIDFEDVKD